MEMKKRLSAEVSRVWWHINRTPFAHLAKAGLRGLSPASTERRRALAAMLGTHCAESLAVIGQLQREGWAKVDHLFDPDCLNLLDTAAAKKLEYADRSPEITQANVSKPFWTRLLDEDMRDGMLPADNPFVQFALQKPIVSILATVLGELPYLDYVLLTLSRHTGRPLASSQLWHLDYDDTRTFKLFVYLTDVTEIDDGPFTFIAGPASLSKRFSVKSHRSDSALGKDFVDRNRAEVYGSRLSGFIVETSRCLHMGSRMGEGHQRLLYTATFLTLPRLFPEGPKRFARVPGTDPLQMAVLRCE